MRGGAWRSGGSVGALLIAAFAAGGCGWIAGLPSDYQLAEDAGADDGGGTEGDATGNDSGVVAFDAGAGGDLDSGSGATSDGAVESGGPGPIPRSDPANVPCGAFACPLATRSCCITPAASTCQSYGVSCGGAIDECAEAANCPPNEVCCVTAASPFAAANRCAFSCSGAPQSCRLDTECPAGSRCIGWSCNGRSVATCGGRGMVGACP